MDKKQSRRRILVTIGLIIVITIIFLIFFDIELVVESIRNADWALLLLAAVILLVGYFVIAIRLRYMMMNKPGYSYSFHTMNISNMVNLVTFIPVSAIRIYLMGESKKLTLPQATSGITIGLVLDFVMKLVIVLIAILLGVRVADSGTVFWVSLVLILGLVALILVLVANADKVALKITPWLVKLPFISQEQADKILSDLAEGLQGAGSPGHLIVTFLISFAAWLFGISFYFVGMMAMGIDLPLERMLLGVVTATIFVNPAAPYLPPTFILLLVASIRFVTGVDIEVLTAYAIVLYAVLLVFWFGLGTIGLRRLKLNMKDLRQQISASLESARADEVNEEHSV